MDFETVCRRYLRQDAEIKEISDKEEALKVMEKSNRYNAGEVVWGSAGEWILLDGIQKKSKWIFSICKRDLIAPFFNPHNGKFYI